MAIIPAATHQIRNHDGTYPFRQNSDFFYLTGFDESDALLLLCPQQEKFKTVLFVLPKDPKAETWTGPRLGVDEAMVQLGIDKTYPVDEIDEKLPLLIKGHDKVALALLGKEGPCPYLQKSLAICQKLARQTRRKVPIPSQFIDLTPFIGPMRAVKSPEEIATIKKGLDITCKGHLAAMAFASPGKNERDIQALLEYTFVKEGGQGPAYESIVASGNNANILHYSVNCDSLKQGDLLLVDAGCEYKMYATDITRTFPVSGTFSPEQRDLYQLVLEAQQAAIASAKPGNTLTHVHQAACDVLIRGLIDLHLLPGSVEEQREKKDFRKYFMHGTSHWLGLDVHDETPYLDEHQKDILLREGHILTVEPGLYFPRKGIGIRIEDDVLITSSGSEVLSATIPKTVSEVEEACACSATAAAAISS